jgi:molybdopterin-guanine dinucleotide biosynthesis protein A
LIRAGGNSGLNEAGPIRNGEVDLAGFVLAGGRSSRMGADKALLSFAGKPLIVHALETLRQAGLSASIAGARSSLQSFAPVVPDAQPDRGPLGGICAALRSTAAEYAVFLSVDQPLLPVSLVKYLLHHARITGRAVTLASINGFAETFPSVLSRSVLPVLEAELQSGRGGCFSAFQAAASSLQESVSVVAVEMLVQAGQVEHPERLPAVRWFANLNRPADLERAMRNRLNSIG